MKKLTKEVTMGLAMGVVMASGLGTAHAEVGYSPAACAAGGAKHGDLVTTRNGEAFNKNTSSSLDVVCPVMLLSNVSKLDVSLFLKKATSETVNCFVHSRYDDGSGGAVKTGSASGSGAKIVYIGGAAHYSTATAGCQLPKATSTSTSSRTGIVSYSASEY